MTFNAFGNGLMLISSFARSKAALARQGYRKDFQMYLLVSSVWTGISHLGNFLGSTLGGFMVENSGFPKSTEVYIFLCLITFVLDFVELIYYQFFAPNHDYEKLS